MKHLFVPYEIALMAEEKGFNEPCLRVFDNGELMSFKDFRTIAFTSGEVQNENLSGGLVAAPIYQQLIDWFRIMHKIVIRIDYNGINYEISSPMTLNINDIKDIIILKASLIAVSK